MKKTKKIIFLSFMLIFLTECFSTDANRMQANFFKTRFSPFYYIANTDEFILKGIKCIGEKLIQLGSPQNYAKVVSANFYTNPTIADSEPEPEAVSDVRPEISSPVEKSVSAMSGNVSVAESLSIKNQTSYTVDKAMLIEKGTPFTLTKTVEPQILIIHTHGTESYTPSEKYSFKYTENTRTTDTEYNVVRVGSELTKQLESYGINVIHDVTMYDYPDYNSSYDKAYYGIQTMLRKYPSVQIVLDIHRDAVNTSTGETVKLVGDVNGEKAAQIMFVVGTDECGFSHPYWQHNLKFSAMLQNKLYNISPNLVRPINLRTARFNQHFTKGSLIVEIGTNGNTLDEALVSAKYLAKALNLTFDELR